MFKKNYENTVGEYIENVAKTFNRIIYKENEFNKKILIERSKADRSVYEFSVIVYFIGYDRKDKEYYKKFAKQVVNRIRVYDEIGWIDRERFGILLVDTTTEKAIKVAEEIESAMGLENKKNEYKVLSYPDGSNYLKQKELDKNTTKIFYAKKMRNIINSENDQQDIDNIISIKISKIKRLEDIIGSIIVIIITLPVWLITAVIIKILSDGPAFYKQERIGYLGNSFILYKFRTMKDGSDCRKHKKHVCNLIENEKPMTKIDKDDKNIIPYIGKMIRYLCIDELPQLINVLRGEMSLVGPRPCLPYEFEKYKLWQKRRVLSVPGITGLWQVSGKNETTFKEMIRLDIAYENRRNVIFDLYIILKTFWVIPIQIFSAMGFKKNGGNTRYV